MTNHTSEKRNELVQIKVSPSEKSLIRNTALREGYKMTTWARAMLLKLTQQK